MHDQTEDSEREGIVAYCSSRLTMIVLMIFSVGLHWGRSQVFKSLFLHVARRAHFLSGTSGMTSLMQYMVLLVLYLSLRSILTTVMFFFDAPVVKCNVSEWRE